MTYPKTHLKLSREQKLLAEIAVQLGNISQAIHIAANSDVDALTTKITELEQRITALQAATTIVENNTPIQSIPDTLNDVVSTLGIELPQ
tara:strand:+ start:4215 stop:4484 length:270 start_codon:yes stop_codon:yes gene_type:complete